MNNTKFHYAWLILAVCCSVASANGIIMQAAATFFIPVAQDLGVGVGVLTIYVTLISLIMAFWLPFSGKVFVSHMKLSLIVSGILLYAGLASMSMFSSVYQFWVAGAVIGIGASVTMVIANPIMINMWFRKKNGFALGFSTAFYALAAAAGSFIVGLLIPTMGWRFAYIVLALLGAILYFPPVILFTASPQQKGILPYGASSETEAEQHTESKQSTFHILSATFILIAIASAFIGSITLEATQITAFCIADYKLAMEIAASMAAIYSIVNLIANLVIGVLADRIGYLKTFFGLLGLLIISQLFFLFGIQTSALLLCGIIATGFWMPVFSVVFPPVVAQVFGAQNYERAWSLIMTVTSLTMALATPIYGAIYDATGSYKGMFLLIIVLTVLAAVNTIIALSKHNA